MGHAPDTLHRSLPSAPLRDFVREYRLTETAPGRASVRPVVGGPHPRLILQLGDPLDAFEYRTGRVRRLAPALVVGPQSRRMADLHFHGRHVSFQVAFDAGGLYRLFGFPSRQLVDTAVAASEVIGPAAARLYEALRHAGNPDQMVDAVEGLLLAQLPLARPAHAVEAAARRLQDERGLTSLRQLAAGCGLSQRQIGRKFCERIGLSPKRFARVVRLSHALTLREQRPSLTWTDISQEAGFFDQAHLVKEFKSLLRLSPSAFARLDGLPAIQ